MARPIEVGDKVSLRFPPTKWEKFPTTGWEETYRIRAIQQKPDQTKIFIKKWFESKGEILTITSQGTVFYGKVQPTNITYVNKDTKPTHTPIPVQSEEEYLVRLTEKLADDESQGLDVYEYGEHFGNEIEFAVEHNYLRVLHMIATNNIEGFRNSKVADEAASSGQVEILKWLGSFDPPIYVEDESGDLFTNLVENGYLDMLKYLHGDREDDFIGQDQLALQSVEGGTFYPEILEWIYKTDPNYVREWGTELPNNAAAAGHMEALTYLESLDPPIRPDKEGIEDARRNNHLDIVDYLESVPLTKSANKR
jgi:hypothetical protein